MDANFIEYCVNAGLISQDKLRAALVKADAGASIYECLIGVGALSQEQLAIAAGDYYHCQVVDLSRVTPDAKAICYSTAAVCRRFSFIPFALDPTAGLLVALADYSQIEAITAFLRDARVEQMKFYIAPYGTLHLVIERCYSISLPEIASTTNPPVRRRPSILHTQYLDLESPHGNDAGLTQLERKVSNLTSELAAYKEENAVLRQRLEQLAATVELDASLLRELGKVLKSTGGLDANNFERWLAAQR